MQKGNRTPSPQAADEVKAPMPAARVERGHDTPAPGPGALRFVPRNTRSGSGAAGSPRPRPEPSWPKVIVTTIILWSGRRLERLRRPAARPRPGASSVPAAGRGRWLRLGILVVVVVLAGVAGVALARDRPGRPAPHRTAPVLTAQQVRAKAAGWIVQQVSRDTILSCDPLMCQALQRAGFPAANLAELRPGAPDPLDSEVIVATGVLRSQFGTRMAEAYAPVVLAGFGSGSTAIQVRAVAPDGAAAYLRQLSADLAARKSFGGQMVANPRIDMSPSARGQLESGHADSRLIAVIGTMAQTTPLRIVSFGDAAPGASAGVPLREAVLMPANGHPPGTTALSSIRSFLNAQQPPYVPAVVRIVRLPAGQQALSVQFAAPGPLGLLAAGQSPINVSS